MKKINIIGIDYSMSSPAICRFSGTKFSFDNCFFHYITGTKKYALHSPQFHGAMLGEFPTNEHKFDFLADWVINRCPNGDVFVYIEDFAFAASGRITDMAENTGVLKNKLFHEGIERNKVAPGTLKKFAIHGRASKHEMIEQFIKETGCDLYKLFDMSPKQKKTNPLCDIVDSFFLCKYGFESIKQQL